MRNGLDRDTNSDPKARITEPAYTRFINCLTNTRPPLTLRTFWFALSEQRLKILLLFSLNLINGSASAPVISLENPSVLSLSYVPGVSNVSLQLCASLFVVSLKCEICLCPCRSLPPFIFHSSSIDPTAVTKHTHGASEELKGEFQLKTDVDLLLSVKKQVETHCSSLISVPWCPGHVHSLLL